MASFDSFNSDYNKCKNLENSITDLLKEKAQKSSSKLDHMIKGKLNTIKYEVDVLLK